MTIEKIRRKVRRLNILINFNCKILYMRVIFIALLMLILSIIQSIAGVGILLIGTPVLLLNGFDIISSINTLLPFSILTSFKSYFFKLKNINLQSLKIFIYVNFFILLSTGVFLGTILILLFSSFINFKIIISL